MKDVGELELTPVTRSIARYLGIDLTPEGRTARNRRGITVLINGPPKSGKSTLAQELAARYNAALLTIDAVIIEAVTRGTSPAALKARDLCFEAAKRRQEEIKQAEEAAQQAALLAEQGGNPNVAPNVGLAPEKPGAGHHGGARKPSSLADRPTKNVRGQQAQQSQQQAQQAEQQLLQASAFAPEPRFLEVPQDVAGEVGLMSSLLPEETVIELLSERFQAVDCYEGMIIDSLDTLFLPTPLHAALCILKALNNRKFLFSVTLKLDIGSLKDREKKAKEEQGL